MSRQRLIGGVILVVLLAVSIVLGVLVTTQSRAGMRSFRRNPEGDLYRTMTYIFNANATVIEQATNNAATALAGATQTATASAATPPHITGTPTP